MSQNRLSTFYKALVQFSDFIAALSDVIGNIILMLYVNIFQTIVLEAHANFDE